MLSDSARKDLDDRLEAVWNLFMSKAPRDDIAAEVDQILTDHTGVSQHDFPNADELNADKALPYNWREQHRTDRSFACGQVVGAPNDPDGWELYELFLRLMDFVGETRANRRRKNSEALCEDLEDYLRGRGYQLSATELPTAVVDGTHPPSPKTSGIEWDRKISSVPRDGDVQEILLRFLADESDKPNKRGIIRKYLTDNGGDCSNRNVERLRKALNRALQT